MDDVRVMRCQESEGASGFYQLGAEFLWTTSPHERSLRRVIAKLQGSAVRSVTLRTTDVRISAAYVGGDFRPGAQPAGKGIGTVHADRIGLVSSANSGVPRALRGARL